VSAAFDVVVLGMNVVDVLTELPATIPLRVALRLRDRSMLSAGLQEKLAEFI
jgi:hypothetical protein